MSSRNHAHCGLADRVPSICVALSQCIAGTGGKSPNQDTQSDKTLQNTSSLTTIAGNHMSQIGNYGSNFSYIGYATLSRQSFLLHIKFYTSMYSVQLAPSTSLDEQTLSSLQCWKGVGLRTDEQETNEMTGGTFPLPKLLSVAEPRREFFYIGLLPPR